MGIGQEDGIFCGWLVGVRGEGVELVAGSPGGVVVGGGSGLVKEERVWEERGRKKGWVWVWVRVLG